MKPPIPARLPLCLAVLALAAPATAEVHAFVGARVIPISGAEIPEGVLVVEGAAIAVVGSSEGCGHQRRLQGVPGRRTCIG